MQLPDALPPTFKGSAVRCSYQLEAKAIFAAQSWKGSTPSSSAPSTEFQSQQSQASTPSTDSPAQRGHALPPTNSSPHLMKYSSSSNVKLSRGREAVGQQQRKGPGIVHVKTPVHLWPAVSAEMYYPASFINSLLLLVLLPSSIRCVRQSCQSIL